MSESAVARRAFQLLRDVGVGSGLRTYPQRAFAGATRYQLHVEGGTDALRILHDAGVLDVRGAPLERPPRRVVRRACCRHAYLRGSLIGGGSVSGPSSPHLEIRSTGSWCRVSSTSPVAQVAPEVPDRGRHAVAYAGARTRSPTSLRRPGRRGSRSRNAQLSAQQARANRLANADHAQTCPHDARSHRQAQAVRRLVAEGRLRHCPAAARGGGVAPSPSVASALRDLGAKCRPPITRPRFHQRLARLLRLSDVVESASIRLLTVLSSELQPPYLRSGSALVRWRIRPVRHHGPQRGKPERRSSPALRPALAGPAGFRPGRSQGAARGFGADWKGERFCHGLCAARLGHAAGGTFPLEGSRSRHPELASTGSADRYFLRAP